LVSWDTAILGFPVGQIERIEVRDRAAAAEAFAAYEAWRDAERVDLVSCRLLHDRLVESMFLEEHGFRFVEMVYSPRLDRLQEWPGAAPAQLRIAPTGPADLPAIQDIAERAFATGRLLMDWRLDPRLSALRYRTWVENSFHDPRHEVLQARIHGDLVGFFVVQACADRSVYWHLTAVAPQWQGQGVGMRLWTAMLARFREAGMQAVETTISAHNAAVLNLYARLGFRFQSPRMTLHWLRNHRDEHHPP
jgi:ribosomal protein S18 acetylase RimI-like enzyme